MAAPNPTVPAVPISPVNLLSNHGPPAWRGKTAWQIGDAIMAAGFPKPSYGIKMRAWKMLGFRRGRKPSAVNFHRQVQELWNFLVDRDDTVKGQTVRAMMLDALAGLGFRYPGKTTDSRDLVMTMVQQDRQEQYNNLPDPVADRVIKQPPGGDVSSFTAVNLMAYPRQPLLDEQIPSAIVACHRLESYHRFQGFCAIQTASTGPGAADVAEQGYRYLQGVPIPYTPDSLWDAIAWWRGGLMVPFLASGTVGTSRPPALGRMAGGFEIKGRIYTWFMQTIKDRQAIRFKDYWKLQRASIVRHDEFGELSMIRSLHAAAPQGRPSYPTWWDGVPGSESFQDGILHVVADYFCTQVIFFYTRPILHDPRVHGATHPADSPAAREQAHYNKQKQADVREDFWPGHHGTLRPCPPGATPYFVRAYGEPNPGEEQIWLVTSDWIHFDAVTEDDTIFRRYGYFPTHDENQQPLTRPPPAPPPPVPPRPAYPPANHDPSAVVDIFSYVLPPSEVVLRGDFSIAPQHITRMPHNWRQRSQNRPPRLAYDPQAPDPADAVPPFRNARYNFAPYQIEDFDPFPVHGTPVVVPYGPFHRLGQQNITGRWPETRIQEGHTLDWANEKWEMFRGQADQLDLNFQFPSPESIDGWTTWHHQPGEPTGRPLRLWQYQLRFGPEIRARDGEKGQMGLADPFYRFKPKYGYENF